MHLSDQAEVSLESTESNPLFHSKPIIGLLGGIGSGKSTIARLFGELGCMVIDSDKLVEQAYNLNEVRAALVQWWGSDALHADGSINRPLIAQRIFTDQTERDRLQQLLFPIVNKMRDQQ